MDKLIANASVGLAKAGMNRRGFLGRLARAAGGAAVLTAGLATAVRADHCAGSHHCVSTDDCTEHDGACGPPDCISGQLAIESRCLVVDCYTRESCGFYHWSVDRCEASSDC